MNLVLEAKTSSKGIGNFKIWYKFPIYHRTNETFFVSISFIWRVMSPWKFDNNVASLLKLHSWFLQSSKISLFRLNSFGQSEVQKSRNHENIFTFRLFTQHGHNWLRNRIVSIPFQPDFDRIRISLFLLKKTYFHPVFASYSCNKKI